jgi:hypothetical protein
VIAPNPVGVRKLRRIAAGSRTRKSIFRRAFGNFSPGRAATEYFVSASMPDRRIGGGGKRFDGGPGVMQSMAGAGGERAGNDG